MNENETNKRNTVISRGLDIVPDRYVQAVATLNDIRRGEYKDAAQNVVQATLPSF